MSIVVAAEFGAKATHAIFRAGAKVVAKEGSDVLFTGFVERRQAQLNLEGPQITVTCQAKGIDAVDSSAKHDTGRFENKTPLDIAKELTKSTGVDVDWSADVDLDKVAEHQIQPGATIFREIEILARDQNAALVGQGDGTIKLTDASKAKRQSGGLFEGVNIKVASSDHNYSGRHDKVTVRGQSYDGHGPQAMQIEATAADSDVDRKRPRIIVLDRNTDKSRAKKHAGKHRDRAAGNSNRAEVETVGWRDEGGALYEPGRLQYTESAFLDIAQDMLIESVIYEQESGDRSGSIVRLGLVDPQAYNGSAAKVSKSGKEWSQDSSEAQ